MSVENGIGRVIKGMAPREGAAEQTSLASRDTLRDTQREVQRRALRENLREALEGVKLELIAEAYHILKSSIRESHDGMRTVFADWNRGELADPLMAAAADALGIRDVDGEPLIEKVLDATRGLEPCARAAALALELGLPAPIFSQSAAASSFASLKDRRVDASAVLGGPKSASTGDRHAMIEELRKALLAATLVAYAESFLLLSGASSEPLGEAKAWAASLGSPLAAKAAAALERVGGESVLLDAVLKSSLDKGLPSLRRVAARCLETGLPVPALSAALVHYDACRAAWLPANLVSALIDARDGRGFERVDRPRGEVFHADWR